MAEGLQAVFQTRYSFFGKSGWRSETSRDKAALLDPERLKKRFGYFEKMTLACLRDQTDPGFALMVLTSEDLPADHAKLLTEACNDVLGAGRVHLLLRPEGSAGRWMQRYMARRMGGADHACQIVLDDDDAVSADFTAIVKREARAALDAMAPGQEAVYLSFADGLTARFGGDGVDLIPRSAPFTNLGLTLVGRKDVKTSPFNIAHKKVARRYPVRLFHDQRPYYIRAVHDTNDSRALHRDEVLDAEAARGAMRHFPLLEALDLRALRETGASPARVVA